MSDVSAARKRFVKEHIDENDSLISTGVGRDMSDPENPGYAILVLVYSDNKTARAEKLDKLREELPSEWEGYPIHVEGRGIAVAY